MANKDDNERVGDEKYGEQVAELNHALVKLVQIFPNVLPEVFREMLLRFDDESRTETVINHLLKHEDLWVKGRWRPRMIQPTLSDETNSVPLPEAECFRPVSYRKTVKTLFLQEFRGLSKSTIKGVLAEQNHSYTLARPILQNIISKSWRHSINRFLFRWSSRSTEDDSEKHPLLRWTRSYDGIKTPSLRTTGNDELNQELYQALIEPFRIQQKARQEAEDWSLAEQINQVEAEDASALFECGCCFSTTTFERVTFCSATTHILCFDCISRTLNEALFGQNWASGINHDRALLKCIAPTNDDGCPGCIAEHATKRAIYQTRQGPQTWQRFQTRLTEKALVKLRTPLVRCPICAYAEATDLYLPPDTIRYRLNMQYPFYTVIYLLLALLISPITCIFWLLSTFRILPSPHSLFTTALNRLTHLHQFPNRFKCRSPTCGTISCTNCSKSWSDPHRCFASEADELRKTVEAARTAALKRTCPRCGLGFVKERGCNKMGCLCGYLMCYICRQGLGPEEGGEG
ncbi:MAG: hypothetical protein Q9222_007158, partial [Ikaeria aurantiellina]